ncbi:hypothetical protein I552_1415 [Mycobacterium xenopi 3993]|nr:hypothetical protein I552_1415 [Mycobacterium xenopi 3993]
MLISPHRVRKIPDSVFGDSAQLRTGGRRRSRRGRKLRSHFADLLIAATAHANGLDLYTRNPDDFAGLDPLVHVVAL